MNIGQLDRLLTVKNQTTSVVHGERVVSYSTAGTIWARQNFTSSSEGMVADKRTSINQIEYLVRYSEAVELAITETSLLENEEGLIIRVTNINEDSRYGRRMASLIKGEVVQ